MKFILLKCQVLSSSIFYLPFSRYVYATCLTPLLHATVNSVVFASIKSISSSPFSIDPFNTSSIQFKNSFCFFGLPAMTSHLLCVFSSLALIFACLSQSSQAYQFIVGGKDGWVLNPSESYSQWAGRNRFNVNDTLFFRYQKGSDSVLVVNKDDYDNCSTGNPILKLDDGNSVFKFDRSGPFYFITGTKENCDKGQKLVTVVLAVRSPPTPSNAASPSPNGSSNPPVISPSSPPSETSPNPSASPSPAPNQVSGPSPSASSPGPNLSPPSTTPPGSPGTIAPGPGNTPEGGNTAPAPSSFAAPACSPKVVLVLAVSVVLSLSLGGFVMSP